MAGFNAAESVKTPDYDFNPYVDAQGVVPEPSLDQIEDFYNTAQDILLEQRAGYEQIRNKRLEQRRADWLTAWLAARTDEANQPELPADDDLPDEDGEVVRQRVLGEQQAAKALDRKADLRQREALSALCSGQPSTEQLIALPPRVFEAFAGYIQGFYSPEARAAATRT